MNIIFRFRMKIYKNLNVMYRSNETFNLNYWIKYIEFYDLLSTQYK